MVYQAFWITTHTKLRFYGLALAFFKVMFIVYYLSATASHGKVLCCVLLAAAAAIVHCRTAEIHQLLHSNVVMLSIAAAY